jgi:hypothetical protein
MNGARLEISRSGTPQQPIEVFGDGHTTVAGITIHADQVAVRGISVVGGQAPGIWIRGSGITVENNTVRHPTGGAFAGIWFFGTDLKILHNTITDIGPDSSSANTDCLQTAANQASIPDPLGLVVPTTPATGQCSVHAACLQTFATGPRAPVPNTPVTHHALIQGNRCQRIDAQCLIVQGPHSRSGTGSGQGQSDDITFSGNYCDAHGTAAVLVDDVQNVTLRDNHIDGTELGGDLGEYRAFLLVNNANHATVEGNQLDRKVRYAVAVDDSSRPGYSGVAPIGAP